MDVLRRPFLFVFTNLIDTYLCGGNLLLPIPLEWSEFDAWDSPSLIIDYVLP